MLKKTTKKKNAAKKAKAPKRVVKARASKPAKRRATPQKKKIIKRKIAKKHPIEKELLIEERLKKLFRIKSIEKESEEIRHEEPNGGELIVEQSKFELGPKENAGEFQSHNLPFDYGQNRIILLVVDPKFAFVYWEVQQDKMHEALSHVGNNGKLTLRFTNIDNNHFWDVSIYERVGNWYLKLDHAEQHLAVEVGMKGNNGNFFAIARSNAMKMPRLGLARPGPIKWMLVSPTGERVITEIEEYTDADLELLKKILGPYFFDLFRRGRFTSITGSSAENIFTSIEQMQPPSLSS